MRTRPGICARKRRYASEAEAVAAALNAAITLRPYRCAICRQYHLTSRTKGMRVLRVERAHPSV
ncbi:hypothetical protein [Novosphingobium sediminicola]|uniref:Uncharacterized protein n=1 Tax=Novosphingobium sediminicola TaxID=563162 RepID=A0A7W6CMP2_9SPHN|nr:hypothetical protein [Novosphingobium sediminicola]MBB3955791.1 hypothetical protein [Novosphingobium sediminicola]